MTPETRLRAELVRAQQDARSTIHRGVLLIALVPLVLLGAVCIGIGLGSTAATVLAILGAATYTLIGSIGGLAALTAGAFEHRRITKELRAIDAPRQLPAARVIMR